VKACFNAIENNKSLIFVAGNMINLHPKQSNTWTSSIIIGVLGYAFVMLFGYFISSTPDKLIVKPIVPVVQEMEVKLEAPPEEAGSGDDAGNSMMSEAVRNLIASTESARVNEEVNYTGDENRTGNAGAQGAQSAASYEQQMRDQLMTNHTDHSAGAATSPDRSTSNNNNKATEQGGNTSYSGPVTATFTLSGRSIKQAPKPTYKCKGAGTVVINITVDEWGKVTQAKIDESRSSKDACLSAESVAYAQRWLFSGSSSKAQSGTISFTFSAQ
jgi:TonB family protein